MGIFFFFLLFRLRRPKTDSLESSGTGRDFRTPLPPYQEQRISESVPPVRLSALPWNQPTDRNLTALSQASHVFPAVLDAGQGATNSPLPLALSSPKLSDFEIPIADRQRTNLIERYHDVGVVVK